jgi:hypothetical protein
VSGATARRSRAALTPAGARPDNNVGVDGRVVLLDFEGAQWRDVAWDVAYLLVPWPSCWCSWRMPDDVASRALAAYRASAGQAFDEVGRAGFERDVETAAVGWALVSTTWFLRQRTRARSGPQPGPADPYPPGHDPAPARPHTARSPELPSLAELAARLAAELRTRWGDVPLALAPAFADGWR